MDKIKVIEEFNDEFENSPQLFTTGAFISPRKITVNDEVYWFWVVDAFEGGDSFYDGEVLNPLEYAETKKGLFNDYE